MNYPTLQALPMLYKDLLDKHDIDIDDYMILLAALKNIVDAETAAMHLAYFNDEEDNGDCS